MKHANRLSPFLFAFLIVTCLSATNDGSNEPLANLFAKIKASNIPISSIQERAKEWNKNGLWCSTFIVGASRLTNHFKPITENENIFFESPFLLSQCHKGKDDCKRAMEALLITSKISAAKDQTTPACQQTLMPLNTYLKNPTKETFQELIDNNQFPSSYFDLLLVSDDTINSLYQQAIVLEKADILNEGSSLFFDSFASSANEGLLVYDILREIKENTNKATPDSIAQNALLIALIKQYGVEKGAAEALKNQTPPPN